MNMRIAMNAPAALVDSEGREVRCTLLDLSTNGFRAKLERPVTIASLVALKQGGNYYAIELRWTSGLELGGRLLERVPSPPLLEEAA